MADRLVTSIGKNGNEEISTLINQNELWSPKKKDHAILEIEAGLHTYYLLLEEKRVDICVVVSPDGKYLRTDPDKTSKNWINELPVNLNTN